MARFRYNGEPARPYVTAYGDTRKIRLRLKDGTTAELLPVAPATKFVVGADIGHDITDERVIRHLTADLRFTQI